jgi:hypothetical protein
MSGTTYPATQYKIPQDTTFITPITNAGTVTAFLQYSTAVFSKQKYKR